MPALNEGTTIAAAISSAKRYGTVIVVDDGSSDNTALVASGAGAVVISLGKNVGYDRAILCGLRRAKDEGFNVAVTFDADGQHHAENIEEIIGPVLRQEADLCIGTRPKASRLAEWLFRIYARQRFGVRDILCGFKAYDLEYIEPFWAVGETPSIGTALTLAAMRRNARLCQVPIRINPRHDTPRLGKKLKANWLIFKAMVADIFGRGD